MRLCRVTTVEHCLRHWKPGRIIKICTTIRYGYQGGDTMICRRLNAWTIVEGFWPSSKVGKKRERQAWEFQRAPVPILRRYSAGGDSERTLLLGGTVDVLVLILVINGTNAAQIKTKRPFTYGRGAPSRFNVVAFAWHLQPSKPRAQQDGFKFSQLFSAAIALVWPVMVPGVLSSSRHAASRHFSSPRWSRHGPS